MRSARQHSSQREEAGYAASASPQPGDDTAAAQAFQVSRSRLRKRVIYGLGLPLLVLNAFFGTYAYVVVQALLWTQTSLLRGPLVLLFFLILFNLLVIRCARRYALSQAELLLLYTMLCLGTCAGGLGFVQVLINQITAVFYFASPSNGWESHLWPHIPLWMAPRQHAVLKSFYQGNATLYTPKILSAWAVPVAAWTAFIFALFWVFLCLVTLMRRRWVEEERLTFPLAHLPLEMTDQGGVSPFWKNRLMWAGFLVAGLLESINSLAYIYPSVPSIPIKPIGPNDLDAVLTTFPWNAAGMLRLAFYPFVIGIGYLLSLDVSFSCWSLYLCVKLANILSAVLGFSQEGGAGAANRAPYIREQSVGAFLGVALLALWSARKALAQAWQEMRRPTGRDAAELMSYRLALLGGGIGLMFLVGFLFSAGLALPVAIVLVGIYLCFGLTLARIVSEVGAGWAWAPDWSPAAFTSDLFGADRLSPQTLTVLHGYTMWMADMRDNPMPQQMQAGKLAQSAGFSARAFLGPLVLASLVGILCAFWAHLHIYYIYGAATAKVRPYLAGLGPGRFSQTMGLVSSPTSRDTAGLVAATVGLLLAGAFSALRLRYAWWPFHPLGYALATTSSMDYMWCPFFVAWLAKSVTLRYGGVRAYRTVMPFFLGLILGDYVVPCLWGLWGMTIGQQQYLVFPH